MILEIYNPLEYDDSLGIQDPLAFLTNMHS